MDLALVAWSHLRVGDNGVDWAGLPFIAELLGVADLERLAEQLRVIRHHRPADDEDA